ncbi:universal stress protein [Saliphagus sp. LR7]|uniref:universal stress protein n=1 Tax=Saliphagus sp. LR7 TaxID=2282654 RepID=UPI000DF81758|nr:universal stress protein [Saliphagus sp. LR7]
MQPDEHLRFPYENIFIPTDGSAGTTRAAQHGLALAESLKAPLHVLSVVNNASLGLDIRSTLSDQEREQAATDAVEEIITEAEVCGVTDTVQHIEHGDPADVILDCIEANDVYAVVMGTMGRYGTDGILLGSVAEGTVRSAPVPCSRSARRSSDATAVDRLVEGLLLSIPTQEGTRDGTPERCSPKDIVSCHVADACSTYW